MKISYNWLKENLKTKKNPKELAELLTMHSFEVEGVQKESQDYILDIDVLPNRASDCLSFVGIAKEIAAIENRKFDFKFKKPKEDKNEKIHKFISVSVKDKNACPRYISKVILDVKVKESPLWLKKRLEALGQKPINNVVDAINYAMFVLGQPMHAFDLDKINGKKLEVGFAKNGQKITTLDGDQVSLSDDILVIKDASRCLAIAGIKGGKEAEVSKSTKNIVLESASFDPVLVRKTSKKINIRTESSLRFENGLHPDIAKRAIDYVCSLILELAGGKLVSGEIDIKNQKEYKNTNIVFCAENIRKKTGIQAKDSQIVSILKRLDIKTRPAKKKGYFIASVPLERIDLSSEEDLAEEFARIYGYENIKSCPLAFELVLPKRNDHYFYSQKAKSVLSYLGLFSVYNYSFVGEKDKEIFGIDYELAGILHPLSEDKKYLRPNLLFGLLKNVKDNLRFQKEVKIFETGKVFLKEGKNKIKELSKVAGAISYKKNQNELFFEIKGIVEEFLFSLGISDVWFDDAEVEFSEEKREFWHSFRVAQVMSGDEKIGILGEVSSLLLEKIDISSKVACFELDFEKIVNMAEEEFEYKPTSKFPAVVRDISLLVKKETKVAQVQSVIENAGGEDLVDVDIFDIYENENSQDELSKSFAFHLVFQSNFKTLSDEEVNKKVQNIINALSEKGWEPKGE